MCGLCHAKTVGEAERIYLLLAAGKITDLPTHVPDAQTPRLDLLDRQVEELADPEAFADQPKFRRALIDLCNQALREKWTMLTFEERLVALRRRFNRPMWSDKLVAEQVAANRIAHGLPLLFSPAKQAGLLAVAEALELGEPVV